MSRIAQRRLLVRSNTEQLQTRRSTFGDAGSVAALPRKLSLLPSESSFHIPLVPKHLSHVAIPKQPSKVHKYKALLDTDFEAGISKTMSEIWKNENLADHSFESMMLVYLNAHLDQYVQLSSEIKVDIVDRQDLKSVYDCWLGAQQIANDLALMRQTAIANLLIEFESIEIETLLLKDFVSHTAPYAPPIIDEVGSISSPVYLEMVAPPLKNEAMKLSLTESESNTKTIGTNTDEMIESQLQLPAEFEPTAPLHLDKIELAQEKTCVPEVKPKKAFLSYDEKNTIILNSAFKWPSPAIQESVQLSVDKVEAKQDLERILIIKDYEAMQQPQENSSMIIIGIPEDNEIPDASNDNIQNEVPEPSVSTLYLASCTSCKEADKTNNLYYKDTGIPVSMCFNGDEKTDTQESSSGSDKPIPTYSESEVTVDLPTKCEEIIKKDLETLKITSQEETSRIQFTYELKLQTLFLDHEIEMRLLREKTDTLENEKKSLTEHLGYLSNELSNWKDMHAGLTENITNLEQILISNQDIVENDRALLEARVILESKKHNLKLQHLISQILNQEQNLDTIKATLNEIVGVKDDLIITLQTKERTEFQLNTEIRLMRNLVDEAQEFHETLLVQKKLVNMKEATIDEKTDKYERQIAELMQFPDLSFTSSNTLPAATSYRPATLADHTLIQKHIEHNNVRIGFLEERNTAYREQLLQQVVDNTGNSGRLMFMAQIPKELFSNRKHADSVGVRPVTYIIGSSCSSRIVSADDVRFIENITKNGIVPVFAEPIRSQTPRIRSAQNYRFTFANYKQ